MPAERPEPPPPTHLQQQPRRDSDPQQQRAGATEFQSRDGPADGSPAMGEGSYEAAREYRKSVQDYLERADVGADAEQARPRSEQEARELAQAEREGRSHSKGER